MKDTKLKQPQDKFRSMLLDKAKQYTGARHLALYQACIELMEKDLQEDTFKGLSSNQMMDVLHTLINANKDDVRYPDVELITKYGKGNQLIYHYQDKNGTQLLTTKIGILIFNRNQWDKFKDNISIYEIEKITKKSFRFNNRKLNLNDLERHLFFQLYHNHNASYEYDGGTKINWKSLKGIHFKRAKLADLTINLPQDMMA